MTAIKGVHPYADKYPMLSDAELSELTESIMANGLRQPIILTADGLILDGRNRAAACERAGVTPDTEIYDGDDLAEYVIDCNSSRRHMSTGARAMATALVLSADGRRNDGRWKRGSVDISESLNNANGSWRVYLSNAGTVIDFAPELAEQVTSGDLALDAAYKKACDARDAESRRKEAEAEAAREEAEAQAFITGEDPELAAQVGTTFQTYAEAVDIWKRRNKEAADKLRREQEAAAKAEKDRRDGIQRDADRLATLVKFIQYGEMFAAGHDYRSEVLAAMPAKAREQYLNYEPVFKEGLSQ